MTTTVATLQKKQGERAFERIEKINAELFTMTYGATVTQFLRDNNDDCEAVNKLLDTMGYNIGIRLIDEFLAKSGATPCRNFQETAEVIAKVGLKMFLGVIANVAASPEEPAVYTLVLEDNPLNMFVELPDEFRNRLWYSNVLAGVIRGALEMVMYRVECKFTRDVLRGDDTTELRVQLLEVLKEKFEGDDE